MMTTVDTLPPQIACGALPDPSGLLASIIAFPEEDTPRLIYADWLDENGQHERAEYIRRFIANGDFGRVHKLWKSLFEPLLDGWATSDSQSGSSPHMDRGFLKRVRCTWESWAKHGDELRAREWVPLVKISTEPSADSLGGVQGVIMSPTIAGKIVEVDCTEFATISRCQIWQRALAIRFPGTLFELPEMTG